MTAAIALLFLISCAEVFGQQAPPDFSGQYHIQTDLGNERFFRFQTHSGQYRKESQKPDGSVEGTYGWVDPNNVLRLFEYVADNLGYRIVKETLYKLGPAKPGNLVAVRGGHIPINFEVYPLDGGDPLVANRQSGLPAQRINIPDGQFQATLPFEVSTLTSTNHHLNPNPLSKQAQATFFSGAPLPPPEPRIVVGAEDTPPAPEPEQTFVVGHTGKSKPAPKNAPAPTFVIGLSHNDEAGPAARAPPSRPRPRPQARPAPAPRPEPRNFIVIGSSRRRRFV